MNRAGLLRFITRGKTIFDIPVSEQEACLQSLGPAKDDLDRSYKQYKCQIFFISRSKVVLLNFISALLMPFVLVFDLLRGMFIKKREAADAIGAFQGLEEIIPETLRTAYSIDNKLWWCGESLQFSDLPFIFRLVKSHLCTPYFTLKCAIKIAKYSHMITVHSPAAIIVHDEFTFTSSVLTSYCDNRKVRHINVMHGEKLYHIRDSYFRFDTCYVWSEYYKDLFLSLNAAPLQFRIAVPPSLTIDCNRYYKQDSYADYKYYLAIFTEEEIGSIVRSMAFAKRQGKSVKYRPHPRYSNIALLEKYVKTEDIEYSHKVSILESVASLSYAVGSYTTVLNQALYAGKSVIMDDVTFEGQYEKLARLRYVLLAGHAKRLSQFQ